MAKHVNIYFKYKDCMYCVILKTAVEDISLAMIEERLYKKLALDESKVKLSLKYIPMVVGCEEQLNICDDEDLFAYLTTIDRDNRRSLLFVEEACGLYELEKLSRVGKSSVGMNYELMDVNDDEIGLNAITPYVEDVEANVEENDDDMNTGGDPYTADETYTTGEADNAGKKDNANETNMDGDKYDGEPFVEQCSQIIEEWEDGLGLTDLQEFPNKKAIQELVDRAAFVKCFRYVTKKSDPIRLVIKCCIESCKWGLRAAKITNTELFSIRRYVGMHSCSRTSQSQISQSKRRGSAELVASFLNEEYPGKVKTPPPRDIIDLIHLKLGVKVSYSTALRGKNLAISHLRGSSEESYKMLPSYLYMLEEANPGTKTSVELDEAGKFKYLFIALGACIDGFAVMRKVIVVDATFLKNGYGGVLVFAKAQDPNRHHYPLAIAVLDGENKSSWTWFFEMLRSVIADSSELVFMSDRNQSLIAAVATVFPQAHHGHCIWHMSQNVRGHASNTNKAVVGWRFMELARCFTMAEFESMYALFKTRYPSAYKYVEEQTEKDTWARVFFPRDRYNLDTSNSVESMNSLFKDARRYSLIPMLDTIIGTISQWFNQRRKEVIAASINTKLVPLVENHLHNMWSKADKTPVRELNSFQLEFEVTDTDDSKHYLVNLRKKSCSCKVYDYDKYPCLHGLAAYLFKINNDIHGEGLIPYRELCSEYYWVELWGQAYFSTIYPVPDKADWNVPDYIRERQVIPKDRIKKKGRKQDKRKPSVGERRKRTQNKRRPRQNFGFNWLLFGTGRYPSE